MIYSRKNLFQSWCLFVIASLLLLLPSDYGAPLAAILISFAAGRMRVKARDGQDFNRQTFQWLVLLVGLPLIYIMVEYEMDPRIFLLLFVVPLSLRMAYRDIRDLRSGAEDHSHRGGEN